MARGRYELVCANGFSIAAVIVIYLLGLKKHPYLKLATENPLCYLIFLTLLHVGAGPFNFVREKED